MGLALGGAVSNQFMRLPICDICEEEISGPVVKKGLLSLCRPCSKGHPHAAPKAPIAPKAASPLPSPILTPPPASVAIVAIAAPRPPPPPITPHLPRVKPDGSTAPIRLVFDLAKKSTRFCIVVGCDFMALSRHLCDKHYTYARKSGQAHEAPLKPQWHPSPEAIDFSLPTCGAIGCPKARRTRGFCTTHYRKIMYLGLLHFLAPPIPPTARKLKGRTKRSYTYTVPKALMIEVVRLKVPGVTWCEAARLAGCVTPYQDSMRIQSLYRRGRLTS
jgi:hypothetical protein